jgi:hypothetical protein
MAFDPVENGFGILTLWIAPPIFLLGLCLPILAFIENLSSVKRLTFNLKMIGALLSFLIAFGTYIITLEPTASLWDCSETIAAAYKLQVPHTPGTPLTLLLGRFFSMMAINNTSWVAWCINLMAGFFSALAVSLTYLISWHYGQRLTISKHALFIGSIGAALCLAFSDSFWFSAVEAETYGPSIFFMMQLLWLAIKGSSLKGGAQKDRIFLISYLTGLAYCIHPMCILILPVCFLVWISDRPNIRWIHYLIAMALGIMSVLFISRVIAVHLFEWAFTLDMVMVNSLSMPFNSGAITLTLFILLSCLVIYRKHISVRVPIIAFLLILAGFSPYLMLFIRSAKNPPINEFSPNTLAKIKPYMNRESYPSRPLIYGPYFDASIINVETKGNVYVKGESKYQRIGTIPQYEYEDNRQTILPRMYSSDPAHIKTYREWTGLTSHDTPRFGDNMSYMLKYQLGHMYFRYLLWNFAGRLSDRQHAGWMKPWNGIPERSSISYNKATNQYFMIPLLIGIIGLLFQFKQKRSDFISNLSFFAITGVLLAIYLNGTPNEPRERDYIYVGSYVAFSIWIGLGMMMLVSFIQPKIKYFIWLLLLIPIWMFYQNLDDHDRSDRTFQMDYARSVLASCEPEAILFTGGDNDTFPLWYLQDVEGFRTDVRVKVLSYFNADWYINQLDRHYYNSPEFDLSLKKGEKQYGPYDPIYIQERTNRPIAWDKFMQAIIDENRAIKLSDGRNEYTLLPSKKIALNTSKGTMLLNVKGRFLPKNEMAILDLIQSNEWERSIYFNFTSLNSLKTNLKDYLIQEGQVYRLIPEKKIGHSLPMDLEKSYENLVTRIDYENLHDSSIYLNHEDFISRMINPLRFNINRLIEEFLAEKRVQKAHELGHFAYENLYQNHIEPSYAHVQLSNILHALGSYEEANELTKRTTSYYFNKIKEALEMGKPYEQTDLFILKEIVSKSQNPETKKQFEELLTKINKTMSDRSGA